ncbi:PEP-CTERM sorting domain-containing protein [Marinobacteraceae bacterium S3BR75-40.1]
MKKITLPMLLLLLFTGTVNAAAIRYDMVFEATEGPDGEGSFVFDESSGDISDFSWTFDGGFTGGLLDSSFYGDISGDTEGRFVLEFLTGLDVHASDCASGGCGLALGYYGDLPGESPLFHFGRITGASTAYYGFGDGGEGAIYTEQALATVPEPTSLGLMLIGLLGAGLLSRRRAR